MTDTPVSSPAIAVPPRRDWVLPLALILAVLALVTTGGLFWYFQTRMQDLEVQLARRIGDFDASSREARAAAKEARTTLDDLGTRLAGLEAKVLESQNQQLALVAMYQELARSQDERSLADVEQTLLLVDQQLHLAGNVRAAVLGLEAAEARLLRMKKPQFERLREAVARDAARLRLLPAADVVGLNARLDALAQNVDKLKPEFEAEAVARPAPARPVGAIDWMERLGRDTWEEIKQLIHVRRLDNPEAVLLTPSQVYFLRQNLKLRLLSARLAALQRDEATYRSDMAAARQWLERYFNRQDALSQAMAKDMKTLEAMPIALADAGIGESLRVLRSLGGRRD